MASHYTDQPEGRNNAEDKYRGKDFYIADRVRKAAYELSSKSSLYIYPPGSVDAVFFDEMILLCSETADYLYSHYTPTSVAKQPTNQHFLRKTAKRIIEGKNGQKEQLLSLLEYVRDIGDHRRPPKEILSTVYEKDRPVESTLIFFGGTEEELIKKGGSMCNELARVLIVLCQLCGIPSRYIGHICSLNKDLSISYPAGHGTVEAYIEGKWVYIDIRGPHFYRSDGTLASTWELMQDPSLIDKQPASVLDYIRPGYDLSSSRAYFAPDTMTFICNYFAHESDRYEYPWIWNSAELRNSLTEFRSKTHQNIICRLNGG